MTELIEHNPYFKTLEKKYNMSVIDLINKLLSHETEEPIFNIKE